MFYLFSVFDVNAVVIDSQTWPQDVKKMGADAFMCSKAQEAT